MQVRPFLPKLGLHFRPKRVRAKYHLEDTHHLTLFLRKTLLLIMLISTLRVRKPILRPDWLNYKIHQDETISIKH